MECLCHRGVESAGERDVGSPPDDGPPHRPFDVLLAQGAQFASEGWDHLLLPPGQGILT
jgi:hypothetical protein